MSAGQIDAAIGYFTALRETALHDGDEADPVLAAERRRFFYKILTDDDDVAAQLADTDGGFVSIGTPTVNGMLLALYGLVEGALRAGSEASGLTWDELWTRTAQIAHELDEEEVA